MGLEGQIRQLIDVMFDDGDSNELETLLADDYVGHIGETDGIESVAELRTFIAELHAETRDLSASVGETLVGERRGVAVVAVDSDPGALNAVAVESDLEEAFAEAIDSDTEAISADEVDRYIAATFPEDVDRDLEAIIADAPGAVVVTILFEADDSGDIAEQWIPAAECPLATAFCECGNPILAIQTACGACAGEEM